MSRFPRLRPEVYFVRSLSATNPIYGEEHGRFTFDPPRTPWHETLVYEVHETTADHVGLLNDEKVQEAIKNFIAR